MAPQTLFILIIAFVVAEFLFSRWLSWLNLQHLSGEIPAELEGFIDADKYAKSQEYTKVRSRFGLISGTFSFIVILGILYFQGFAWLDSFLRQYTENPVLLSLAFFGILSVANGIIGLPFSIYSTFVIEERFGFNRTTVSTYIVDMIKGAVLGAIIGGGLLALVVWLYTIMGPWFWVVAWATVTLVSLFITMFYTAVLVPIFNKLKPLEDGELRTALEEYSKKVNFPLKNVMVMDSSKRSSKSNAYFSGIGARKTIVLYDTLIQNHTTDELVAVIAHEVGHYKRKHVRNGFILSVAQTGLLLFIFGLLAGSPLLAQALGAQQASFHIGLIAFSMLYSPIGMVTGIFMNMYSRKNEFEADAYARDTYNARALGLALKKLSVDNLSNFRPHPIYVFVEYSHPPLLERLKAMNS
jgi:STE24 endopeptidase